MSEIAAARIATDKLLVTEGYARNRELGAFVPIERMTNWTVVLGASGPAAEPQISKINAAPANISKPRLVWWPALTHDRFWLGQS